MGRLATGIMIAVAALVMGGVFRDVQAGELQSAAIGTLSSTTPVASGLRSERVMSPLLTLEALRAAPEVMNPSGK